MSSRHIINKYGTFSSRNINFYCTLKNDIALCASASCNIIFPCWQWSPMVSTELPTMVTELPKLPLPFHQVANGLQWSPLSCHLLWQSCVKHWQPLTTLSQQSETHSELVGNSFTIWRPWQRLATFLNSLKKLPSVGYQWRWWQRSDNVVATSWRSLATGGNVLAIPRNYRLPPRCEQVASKISASVKGA